MDYFLLGLNAKKYVELDAQEDIDVVLVHVQDAQNLRQAYPSYFLDTTQFLNSLDELLTHVKTHLT